MLSYRHGFHAGNAADVLKHSILVFCLDYMTRKEKPLLCVDTHAGAGFYDLESGFAAQKREWEEGVKPLLEKSRSALPPMISRYLEAAAGDDPRNPLRRYPGSPAIMSRLLRPGDRLVCFELHPADFEALSELGLPAEIRRENGPQGLRALLPPPSRRALVLVDPAWELKSDYETIPRAVREALRRLPGGMFLIWYPLLRDSRKVCLTPELFPGVEYCRAELRLGQGTNSPRGMYGSGLYILNPPWTLRAALEETLPFLVSVLGRGADQGWDISGLGV